MPGQNLPSDVWSSIFKKLGVGDLLRMRLVRKSWKNLANKQLLEDLKPSDQYQQFLVDNSFPNDPLKYFFKRLSELNILSDQLFKSEIERNSLNIKLGRDEIFFCIRQSETYKNVLVYVINFPKSSGFAAPFQQEGKESFPLRCLFKYEKQNIQAYILDDKNQTQKIYVVKNIKDVIHIGLDQIYQSLDNLSLVFSKQNVRFISPVNSVYFSITIGLKSFLPKVIFDCSTLTRLETNENLEPILKKYNKYQFFKSLATEEKTAPQAAEEHTEIITNKLKN